MADELQSPGSPSVSGSSVPTFQTVSKIIELLEPLSVEDRTHVLQTVTTWLRLPIGAPRSEFTAGMIPSPAKAVVEAADEKFSNREVQSAKDFLFEKAPNTESERVACLGYYLTHFLDTPHFRNIEISNLNTEAAQRKLTNPGVAVSNAMRDGFLVAAPKSGHKQLSALGERFVQLLPDRAAAQEVKARMAARRPRRSSNGPADDVEKQPAT